MNFALDIRFLFYFACFVFEFVLTATFFSVHDCNLFYLIYFINGENQLNLVRWNLKSVFRSLKEDNE